MLRDDLLKLWQERDYAQLSIEQLESDTPANEAAVGQADGDAAQLGTDESRELVEAISQNVGYAMTELTYAHNMLAIASGSLVGDPAAYEFPANTLAITAAAQQPASGSAEGSAEAETEAKLKSSTAQDASIKAVSRLAAELKALSAPAQHDTRGPTAQTVNAWIPLLNSIA